MKVLIIDNTLDQDYWGSNELSVFTEKANFVSHIRRGPHSDLPSSLKGYDRVVISGSRQSCLEQSEWVNALDQLIRSGIDSSIPILGVCYGHQSIIRAIADVSYLRQAQLPEVGWISVEVRSQNKLFEGLPKVFNTFASHYEEVAKLPVGCQTLASSERCAIQAFQLKDKPVFGIQFHPEKGIEEAQKTFKEKTLKGEGKILLRPRDSATLFKAEVGSTIFENFFFKI